jgi:hypothetical protein
MMRARPAGIAVGTALFLTVAASTAYAGNGPPQAVSSIAEYVEVVPTTVGPRAIGGGSGHAGTLPRAAARAVRKLGGRDAGTLTRIATSSGLGAPPRRPESDASTSTSLSSLDRFSRPGALGAVAAALRPLGTLGAVLLALTVAAGVAATRRGRASFRG